MKKILFALSGLLLLSIASCSKEEIKPNQSQNEAERVVVEQFDFNKEIESPYAGNNNLKGRGAINITNPSDTTNVITDPNRDEDEERKVKRK